MFFVSKLIILFKKKQKKNTHGLEFIEKEIVENGRIFFKCGIIFTDRQARGQVRLVR